MKISKIPGLGRFGIFIDDVDFTNISDDQWMEIGRLHLNSLVTIIRNTGLDRFRYQELMARWGTSRNNANFALNKKYNANFLELAERVNRNDRSIDSDDAKWMRTTLNMVEYDSRGYPTTMLKVTGRRTESGEPLGMFAEGELLWHSNESGTLTFTPAVSLLAAEGVVGSATGFATTTDWYESQSESLRSELDDMVLIHNFTPGKINPGLREEQDFIMYRNMCPVDGTRIPLVIQSPGGIRGLHFSPNTAARIEGMSRADSDRFMQKLQTELFSEQYVYDHWYQTNSDLCLFDNSITQHRRLGGITNRLCYRIQYDYTHLQNAPYMPYFQEPFRSEYKRAIHEIVKYLGSTDFKLPRMTFKERVRDLVGL